MQKNIWIAAKYLRLSIEDGDKAESESIVNQSILIDNYMKSTSHITIVETFKDDGFSGTDFNRPGFQAMLKAIENKEINCIIVKDLSRFGREHIDVDRYIQKVFPQLGVRFIAINDNYDSETANITDTHLVLPVKSFVNDITKFDVDFDLVSGRYVIDAKSIMGIFSLDLSKPIDLNIHAENQDADNIIELLKPYLV